MKTIRPATELPEITEAVTIDGYSQPGAQENTLPISKRATNAQPLIQLNGKNAVSDKGPVSGLNLAAPSVVKGLVINRFSNNGISIRVNTQNVTISGADSRIEGNFIGTDPSGTKLGFGNGSDGVDTPDHVVTNITVGGNSPAARNLISGNNEDGVQLFEIGGSASDSNNHVLGNLIGTKKDGKSPLGNLLEGVDITGTHTNSVSGNVIAFNGDNGVRVEEGSISVQVGAHDANSNLILGNSIFSNGRLGIDLGGDGVSTNDALDTDEGPNTLQNKPKLTSAKTTSTGKTVVKGKLNSTTNTTFIVQLFSNGSDNEGKKFIGQLAVSTDGSGNASFTFKPTKKVALGQKITATATDPSTVPASVGGTSEFSAARKVVAA